MGMYQAIREAWKKPQANLAEVYKQRLIVWRSEPVIVSSERPTRLDRARSLGYRAKKGISIARVRVDRGGRMRGLRKSGRRTKTQRRKKIVGMSYQWIAENRAQRHFTNLEVLNSYFVGKDGLHYWFEVIMVDPCRPEIINDKQLKFLCNQRNRVFRGKTSAGRRSRGLHSKGIGTEKIRPSRRANLRRSK